MRDGVLGEIRRGLDDESHLGLVLTVRPDASHEHEFYGARRPEAAAVRAADAEEVSIDRGLLVSAGRFLLCVTT